MPSFQPSPDDIEWRDNLRRLTTSKLDDALCDAVGSGSVWRVSEALAAGANVHTAQEQPIRKAAVSGHYQIAKLLLDAGAKLHVNDEEPLCWAARGGHVAVVELLLSRGADDKSYGGRRAREWAKDYKQASAILLIDSAALLRQEKAATGTGMAEKIAADVEAGNLPLADIKKGDVRSEIFLHLLGDAGQLDMLFDPKKWAGDAEGALRLWERIPKKYQNQIDLASTVSAVKREALKPKPGKFKLG